MSIEGESLGKSRLDLEANLTEFRRNMKEGKNLSGNMSDSLSALAAVADIAEQALGDVKMSPFSATESGRIADRIEGSVGRVGAAAAEASRHLERVKLDASNAAETIASGDVIDNKLNDITENANEARRALDRVKLRLAGLGGALASRSRTDRPGYGVGPFGSGYGRIGVFGAAVAGGVLTGPAAGPGALGLLAGIPTLAAGGAGALGTLALAFQGVGKAIGGDYKAFKQLEPAQQKFVQTVRSMIPWIDRLKQMTGSIMFPGLTTGLRSALSPGTVGAITGAIREFAQAIGLAGEAWGRYFGSAQFQQLLGPLMKSGARNLLVMSKAAISMFDALAVLGRAATPLVNWLADLAAKGSALADAWLRSKDASGGLARAMGQAQSSLRLVGGLLYQLGRAVWELGRVLFPVALEAVKDLTGGLSALADWLGRNRESIGRIATSTLRNFVAVITTTVHAVGWLYDTIKRYLGPGGAVGVFAGLAAAIGLLINPWTTVLVVGVTVAGAIIRHWDRVKVWFGALEIFMVDIFKGAWAGIMGVFDYGVYYVLSTIKLIPEAVGRAFEWVPIIGPKIKAAFTSFDSWVDGFSKRGAAEFQNAGSEMGSAWGDAFASTTRASLKKVSAAMDEWSHGHRKKALNDLAAQGFTVDLLTGKKIPTAAPHTAVPSIDWDKIFSQTGSGDPFGNPPPFTKNLPTGKGKPAVLPPRASHALDLAVANANKAKQLGNVGLTAKRYLDYELADLQTAAKLIREKYEHATGKVRTELFHALTSVQNKIRNVRKLIHDAIKKDRLAEIQFALGLAELALDSAKEGSAAYKRAEQQEIKLLRSEISYLDKRVKNKKLSLALRQEALSAEISARQQLNALVGQTATNGNANEAQFLSSFQQIVHAYAPDAFTDTPTTKPLETKGHETVTELRSIKRILERIAQDDLFPASGYGTAAAQAAFG